jgi:hypothetical protein
MFQLGDIQAADRSYRAEALDDLSDLAERDTPPITSIIDNYSIGVVRQVSRTERYINQC